MRTGGARAEAEPVGFIGQGFNMPRHRIVALVAMQINHQATPRRDFA